MLTTTKVSYEREVPLHTTHHSHALPKLVMSRAQEQMLAESYCRAVKGQDARDVRAGKRTTHLLVLRPAARMLEQGAAPCEMLAYYQLATATVEALCLKERRSFAELSLAEQDANHQLDRTQIVVGAHPSPSELMSIVADGQQQIARTMAVVAEAQRLLGERP